MKRKPKKVEPIEQKKESTGYEGMPDQQLKFFISQTTASVQEAQFVAQTGSLALQNLLAEVDRRQNEANSKRGGIPRSPAGKQ